MVERFALPSPTWSKESCVPGSEYNPSCVPAMRSLVVALMQAACLSLLCSEGVLHRICNLDNFCALYSCHRCNG